MADQWRDYLGQNAMAPGLTASNVEDPETMSGVPVRQAGGSLVPAPDTSGLYAIYGKRNPYSAKASRLGAMAGMDMGGRLGQLPGIAATIMAGKAEKKSEAFEKERQGQIDAFLSRKEAYDKIKNERDTRQSNAKYLTDSVFPAAQQEYARVLQESKDLKAASASASKVANKMAADAGIPAPEVVAFNAWKGASSMSVINDKGKKSTAIFKDGAFLVQDEKGDFQPPTEKWLNIKDVADLLDSEARQQRAATGGLKGKEHGYLTASGELLFSKDPDDAVKRGAVKVMRETRDEDGIMSSKEYWLPGKAPKDEAPPAEAGKPMREPGLFQRGINKLAGNEVTATPRPAPGAQPQAAAPKRPGILSRAASFVSDAAGRYGQRVSEDASFAADKISGGGAPAYNSAEDVRAAFNAGKINALEAKKVLAESFNMR